MCLIPNITLHIKEINQEYFIKYYNSWNKSYKKAINFWKLHMVNRNVKNSENHLIE